MRGKITDLSGHRSGRLVAVEHVGALIVSHASLWRCVCDCGGEKIVAGSDLKSGGVKSCGCLFGERSTAASRVGQKFNRVTVMELLRRSRTSWVVRAQCDCGKVFEPILSNVVAGLSQSCGCLAIEARTTHGMSKRPEFHIWCSMLQRCENDTLKSWKNYGGRGITVCERWHDFAAFIADMGPRPSLGHSVNRIDNNGPYSPENCKWSTRSEQARNTRKTRLVPVSGIMVPVCEAEARLGISHQRFYQRLDAGYTVEEAANTPKGQRPQRLRGQDALARLRRIRDREAARATRCGRPSVPLAVSRPTYDSRIRAGWHPYWAAAVPSNGPGRRGDTDRYRLPPAPLAPAQEVA